MTDRLPALFLGHGSPMTTITDGPERRNWIALGQALPRPKAILVVSAHWETTGTINLTAGAWPRTIHDFRGFPAELYAVQYPAPGSDWLIERIEAQLSEERIARDASWGFDHGAWGVIQPMFPEADIPLVAMSLDRGMTPDEHLQVASKLAPLRDQGVLLVGSGNIIHNLSLWHHYAGTVPEWSDRFRTRINTAVRNGDHPRLTRFEADDEAASAAINSGEHYLPLLYAAGARLPGDQVCVFNDTIDGALSMTCYGIGDPAPFAGLS